MLLLPCWGIPSDPQTTTSFTIPRTAYMQSTKTEKSFIHLSFSSAIVSNTTSVLLVILNVWPSIAYISDRGVLRTIASKCIRKVSIKLETGPETFQSTYPSYFRESWGQVGLPKGEVALSLRILDVEAHLPKMQALQLSWMANYPNPASFVKLNRFSGDMKSIP